jgi:hypothetical protein
MDAIYTLFQRAFGFFQEPKVKNADLYKKLTLWFADLNSSSAGEGREFFKLRLLAFAGIACGERVTLPRGLKNSLPSPALVEFKGAFFMQTPEAWRLGVFLGFWSECLKLV